MSDNNLPNNDLPAPTFRRTEVVVKPDKPIDKKWTPENTGQVIDVLGKGLEVAKVFTEITRIDTEGRIQVNAIDAQTRQMEIRIRGEIERLREAGYTLKNRGQIAHELTDSQLTFLNNPALPEAVKVELVKGLPKVIEATLNDLVAGK